MKLQSLLFALCLTPPLAAQCPFNLALQESDEPEPEAKQSVRIALPGLSTDAARRTFTLGVGAADVLDTYLSPLSYTGTAWTADYRSEKQLSWWRGRISRIWQWHAAYGHVNNPQGNASMHDGELSLDWAAHYNRLVMRDEQTSLRLAFGPQIGARVGGTYHNRNGNNPAQGRVALELGLSAVADYRFRLFGTQWQWRTQGEMPLVGAMFTPHYGESYYQLFGLGHGTRNVRATTPWTAPSFRLQSQLSLPFWHRRLSIGIDADIRQSHLNGLKRHRWNTALTIGYTRTLQFSDR